ncbi:hypothetical protein PFICI_02645 [Pestalotiopsis fici W106-1]|uniref:Protein kinase domain-containing protein n=1 Tax=Pestalotiopsis fici (strain W106-1 / CGMCC3.15140) TaxID=1229662 RepID=W3XEZ6_PESFW|nr:uncharacterized protein PFICI_02645 [Pestalotiopsis fici W106-1]ETS84620.1 hypothetical protein PFICI_02645 [Pestalotiopsis fici W106-1]
MSLATTNPPGDESDRVQRRLRSNQSAFAEPWSGLASSTPRGRRYSVSRPRLEVPAETWSTTSSERFHARRRSGSSASPIESDRRTVVTVEDPLSDSDSAYDRDNDTDKEQNADERPAIATAGELLSNAGEWETLNDDLVQTSFSSLRNVTREHHQVPDMVKSQDYLKIKRVQQELRSSHIHSQHKTQGWFIPYDKLRAILTRRRVRSILLQTATFQTTPSEILDMIARSICTRIRKQNGRRTGYIRIFAILVLIDQVRYIVDFLNELITDADLPLRPSPYHPLGSNLVMRNSDDDDVDSVLICFEDWKPEDMDNFIGQQEKLISPRFRMRGDQLCLHRLPSNTILPFVECGRKAYLGGFGRVSKVKIHPAHCDFDPRTLPHASSLYGPSYESREHRHVEHEFALKEIQSDDYTLFRAEIGVHEKFSASRKGHEHLIRLLAAIEHGTSYYLLFPWAQGTLVDLWQRFEASPDSPDHVEWLIKQCLGIADGLQRIHLYRSSLKRNDQDRERSLSKNKGTHGDVKAENILFFDPPGKDTLLGNKHLVVSDFGLTRFREASQASDPHGFSRTYRAPELDMQHATSRKYDVWSLGCLFLEFTSWFLLGFHATRSRLNAESGSFKSFVDVRIENDEPYGTPFKEDKFFNLIQAPGIGNIRAVVKPSVLEWMNKLRQMNECSEPIRSFIDMIEFEMLVPDKQDRMSMVEIRDGLRRIYNQCRPSEGVSISDVLLYTDQANNHRQPEINHVIDSSFEPQSPLNGGKHEPASEMNVSEASSPIDHSQKLIEELERIHEASMGQLDADETATQSSTNAVPYPPYQQQPMSCHSQYHDTKDMDIPQCRGADGLEPGPSSIPSLHHLSTPTSRRGPSGMIIFTSPNNKDALPYITEIAPSAEVSRRNTQESLTLAGSDVDGDDIVRPGLPSCQERGEIDPRQSYENTPLLPSLHETLQQDGSRVAVRGPRGPILDRDANGYKQVAAGGSSWLLRIFCGCYMERRRS